MTEQPNPYEQGQPVVADADRTRALTSLANHLDVDPASLADAAADVVVDRPNLRYSISLTLADHRRFVADFAMRRRYEDHEWEWREG